MPELPEVETTRRGLAPHLEGRRILALVVRERRLRWPVEPRLEQRLAGQRILALERRAKYLLFRLGGGSLILHLGMSGSLRLLTDPDAPARRHDHVEFCMEGGQRLVFHDPRRFGSLLWTAAEPLEHPLLQGLGPEPLETAFSAAGLAEVARGRRTSVKQLLMDARTVVGVGNIYANEALHLAGIDPRRAAPRIAARRYEGLVQAVRQVLGEAIEQGGTTLRDYVNSEGAPGYFRLRLRVYGRAGEPCTACSAPIRRTTLGQRSTFFCPRCQH